jgi:signal peptidase I
MPLAPSDPPTLSTAPSAASTWRANPIIAAFLNLYGGIGLVYAGRLAPGIGVYLLAILWTSGLMTASCYGKTAAQRLSIAALVFGAQVVGWPTLAYVVARRTPASPKRWYQRWYGLLLYAVVVMIVGPRLVETLAPVLTASYRVTGMAMQPTLEMNDRVVAGIDLNPILRRGDVVIFVNADGHRWISRIVGLPGDTVELRDFHARVNGQPEQPRVGPCLHEDTPASWSPQTRALGTWGPMTVPDGQYALFGDCRDNAIDVRRLGFASRAQIVRRLSWILWSPGDHGPRWDRIGQRVQ